MDHFTAMRCAYWALCLVLVGLLFYVRHRSKKLRLAAIDAKIQAKAASGVEPFSDDFYCIMRTDGTCSSGYISSHDSAEEKS